MRRQSFLILQSNTRKLQLVPVKCRATRLDGRSRDLLPELSCPRVMNSWSSSGYTPSFSAIIGALMFCLPWVAFGNPITYDLSVDTSSITGTIGSLDLNFNPGPLVTQSASLQILNFTSNGLLAGGTTLTGDVAGVLPATLTFDNGTGFNDYFEGFTFGSTLSFQVSLYGPALSSPDGTSTSGSTFAFSMFSDADGTIPTLTSDTTNGFAATIDVNLDGSTSMESFIQGQTIVPEPTSFGLCAASLVLTVTGLGRLKSRSALPHRG